MYLFRLLFIFVIAWVILVFNLERPDDLLLIGSVDIATPVYFIVVWVLVSVLVLPRFNRAPFYMSLSVIFLVYAITKYFLGFIDVTDPQFAYITLVEILVLIVTLWVGRVISNSISNFEQAIEGAIFEEQNAKVLDSLSGEQAIGDELLRARYYQRSVTLIYIHIVGFEVVTQRPFWQRLQRERNLEERYLKTHVAGLLHGLLYPSDMLTWYNGGLVICLPETSKLEARPFVRQLHQLFDNVLKIDAEIGVAGFPEDGLIYDDLMQIARSKPIRATQEMKVLAFDDELKEAAH